MLDGHKRTEGIGKTSYGFGPESDNGIYADSTDPT